MDKRLKALACYLVAGTILIGIIFGLIGVATRIQNPLLFTMYFIVAIMILLITLANIEIMCDTIEYSLDME